MREREIIKQAFEAGETNSVLDVVGPELILEAVLDIRELLIVAEERNKMIIRMVEKRKAEE